MSIRKSDKFTQRRRMRFSLVLALLLGIFQQGWGSSAVAQTAKENPSATPRGHEEGIKVHGHWTIEVRNPDGTVVDRREFENALVPGSLSNILARRLSVGLWTIFLNSITIAGPCGINTPCIVSEPKLTVMVDGVSLVLAGNVTVSANTTIDEVETIVGICGPNVAPSTPCTDGGATVFTRATPPQLQPVNVVAGQIVQVTVVISFS